MVYSWFVKKGLEIEFVNSWRDFARWMTQQAGSTKTTRLFRDISDGSHFMSVDSWENEKWLMTLRAQAEFDHQLDNLRRFLYRVSSWPLKVESEEQA